MAIGSTNLNLFSQSTGMKAINPTQAVNGQTSAAVSSGSNGKNPFASKMFSGETVGLNSMQPGDSVYTPAQAGKSAGVSRVLYNA